MTKVLVPGGSGLLGRHLVPRLIEAGHEVNVTSRKDRAPAAGGPRYQRVDLATGEGLSDAVATVQPEVVINLATSLRRMWATDVDGVLNLARACLGAPGFSHFIQVGIVGDDLIPFRYYKAKTAAEHGLKDIEGLPLTVQRATQFHDLVGEPLLKMRRLPLAALPKSFRFQVIDAGDVAQRLVELVDAEPANGRGEDMGGPVVLTLGEMAKIAGLKRVVNLPLPGKVADGFRQGLNTCPDQAVGSITFQQWVDEKLK